MRLRFEQPSRTTLELQRIAAWGNPREAAAARAELRARTHKALKLVRAL